MRMDEKCNQNIIFIYFEICGIPIKIQSIKM